MGRDRRAGAFVAALRRRVEIDTRALAAFRIAIGILLVADLLTRLPDLVAFYTDAGVVPRSALDALAPGLGSLSIHALWGSALPQLALFALAGVAALAMVVGYRTRVATLVSFVLLVSIHVRNPAVLNGGDSLLRHLLLWGIFLPLGERWSADAVASTDSRASVAEFASAGLLLQVVLVYATNAVLKLRGSAWVEGGAVEQVLLLTRFSTPLGELLLDVPFLPAVADFGWLALLVSSPLLVVLPGRARFLLATAFALFHGGMALFLGIGLFPYISIAALLPFVPSSVWDRLPAAPELGRSLPEPRRRLSIDGVPVHRPIAAVLLASLFVVNAGSVGLISYPDSVPDAVEDKSWNMFAPGPPSDDGWYVAPAVLESGRTVDALQGAPLDWDRPPDVDATYPNNRWQKLLYQLRGPPESVLKQPLAEYLCHRWNGAHDDEARRIRLVYVSYPTDGSGRGDRVALGRYDCP